MGRRGLAEGNARLLPSTHRPCHRSACSLQCSASCVSLHMWSCRPCRLACHPHSMFGPCLLKGARWTYNIDAGGVAQRGRRSGGGWGWLCVGAPQHGGHEAIANERSANPWRPPALLQRTQGTARL